MKPELAEPKCALSSILV
uniref:Uncharacterized protein n=1 Tax=Arundo donax TaxID=35708 RepID=A0A0A9C7M2_ARUDO